MTRTINKEKFISKLKNLSNKATIQEVPNIYFDFVIECSQVIPEMTDKEFMFLPGVSGSLKFWEDKSEDIYSLEDGEPING
jgi:hypothetical protein